MVFFPAVGSSAAVFAVIACCAFWLCFVYLRKRKRTTRHEASTQTEDTQEVDVQTDSSDEYTWF